MRRPRVRHHTSDDNLERIQADGFLTVSRGWGNVPRGVHVEVEPLGTTRPFDSFLPNRACPQNDLSLPADGAFFEFDEPAHLLMVRNVYGKRNTAIIVIGSPLVLAPFNPRFVKVRRHWWEFWRSKAE